MNGKSGHFPASSPLIIGHRGASAVAPENTLAAFSRAIRDGADGIEFDVRLSRDHVPVVIHDATLERTGLTNALVGELTAKELRMMDVGSWFDSRNPDSNSSYAGQNLPTLEQVLELFTERSSLLYLEMKSDTAVGGTQLAAEVVRFIRKYQMTDRVVVESFDLSAIAEVKRIDSGIRTAALFEPKLTRPVSTVRRMKMVDFAVQCAADEIALHHTLVSPRVIEKAKGAGLEIVVWTVDKPDWVQRARTLRIKAIITNDPATIVQNRDR